MRRTLYKGTYSNQTLRFDIRSKIKYICIKDQLKMPFCERCNSHACRASGVTGCILLDHPKKSLNKQRRKYMKKNGFSIDDSS